MRGAETVPTATTADVRSARPAAITRRSLKNPSRASTHARGSWGKGGEVERVADLLHDLRQPQGRAYVPTSAGDRKCPSRMRSKLRVSTFNDARTAL
jgi:hypothetical protein